MYYNRLCVSTQPGAKVMGAYLFFVFNNNNFVRVSGKRRFLGARKKYNVVVN